LGNSGSLNVHWLSPYSESHIYLECKNLAGVSAGQLKPQLT